MTSALLWPLPPLFASLLAAFCFYLAAPRQRWLARPLPGRPVRLAGGFFLVIAYWLWRQELQPATAFFLLLSLKMLLFTLLPALSLYKSETSEHRP
jgi:hypothetical protein